MTPRNTLVVMLSHEGARHHHRLLAEEWKKGGFTRQLVKYGYAYAASHGPTNIRGNRLTMFNWRFRWYRVQGLPRRLGSLRWGLINRICFFRGCTTPCLENGYAGVIMVVIQAPAFRLKDWGLKGWRGRGKEVGAAQ